MSYWSKRMKKAQENWSNKNIDAINAQMKKYYSTAMNQAINDYTALYEKIEAKIAAGEEVSVANLYALDKYWQTQAQMKEELQKLGDKQETLLAEKFEKEYADIHKAVSITGDKSFNLINKANAEQVAREIWAGDGKNYSQRLWQNVNKLQQMLDDELVSCVAAGRKTTALKQGLMEKFNVSYRQADRLARTEIAHIEVEASRRRWQDEGVQQVEIYVDEDERTCPQCSKLEGKKYKITEQMPVPVHPSCRCTILPIIPEGVEYKEIEDDNMDKIKLDESALEEWNELILRQQDDSLLYETFDFIDKNGTMKLENGKYLNRYKYYQPTELKRQIYQSMMNEEDAEKYDTLLRQVKQREKRWDRLYRWAPPEEWAKTPEDKRLVQAEKSAHKLYKKTMDEINEMEKDIHKLTQCPSCGKLFMKGSNSQKYCPECQREYRKRYKAQKEKERRAKNKNK